MLLEGRNAVIYGGGGAIGGAVARAFARQGARLHLAGRTLEPLERVAEAVRAAGGVVEVAQVDALDERAVDEHADAVAAKAGSIDICFNLISHQDVQGTALVELALADFERPVHTAVRTMFLTSRAAAPATRCPATTWEASRSRSRPWRPCGGTWPPSSGPTASAW